MQDLSMTNPGEVAPTVILRSTAIELDGHVRRASGARLRARCESAGERGGLMEWGTHPGIASAGPWTRRDENALRALTIALAGWQTEKARAAPAF